MKQYLPDIYESIAMYASVLPGHSTPPAYPFSGFVLNVNVSTLAHRDGKDLLACLVIPVGSFTGGELGLVEPGLLLRLRTGDAVIFPSCDITHFNTTYTGTRASLVCHSDRAGMDWVENRLGWQGHSYLDSM